VEQIRTQSKLKRKKKTMQAMKEEHMLKTQLETPRIEDCQSLLLAGLQQTYSMSKPNDLGQQWQHFVPQIPKLPGKGGMVAYGAIFHPAGSDNFAYLTCVEITDSAKVPSGFSVANIPQQKYAIFSHPGHVSEIKKTIGEIWEHWLPSSGYRRAGDKPGSVTMLERYGEGFDPKTGMGDIELWVPVKN
jgi:AraC family transcriptional regulator